MKRLDLYLSYDRPMAEVELIRIREALPRLVNNEPIAYIVGHIYFFDLKITVNRNVLIPRPETEILVEELLKRIQPESVILDVCCGSGCIGLALKNRLPSARVLSSDISEEALQVARENAARLNLHVEHIQSDLFEKLPLEDADVIVINPPYVSETEYQNLDPSVKNFEPKIALVGGSLGTEMYSRIMKELIKRGKKGALVGLEIGATQSHFFEGFPYEFEFIRDYSQYERHVLFTL